jgi:L-amino acid N-acyltransferase YncA
MRRHGANPTAPLPPAAFSRTPPAATIQADSIRLKADVPIVRPAGVGDMAAVTAIYANAVLNGTGTFELVPPSIADMTARHTRITGGGYPYIVALDADGVVGFAYAFAYRDRPAYRFTVEDSIYVRDGAQGRGIGAILLSTLIEDSTALGFRQMIAVIGDSDNAGSIRLHQRAGFEHSGVLQAAGWKAGRWLDVVLMQRALGEAGTTAPPDA